MPPFVPRLVERKPVAAPATRRVSHEAGHGTLTPVDDDTAGDVGEVSRGDRPFAPGDLPARQGTLDVDLVGDFQARIVELDAVAWNLPTRRASAPTARDDEDVPDD
jgi:hypothetical protein